MYMFLRTLVRAYFFPITALFPLALQALTSKDGKKMCGRVQRKYVPCMVK